MATKKFTVNVAITGKVYCSWDDLAKILIEGSIFRTYSARIHVANMLIAIRVTIKLCL